MNYKCDCGCKEVVSKWIKGPFMANIEYLVSVDLDSLKCAKCGKDVKKEDILCMFQKLDIQ